VTSIDLSNIYYMFDKSTKFKYFHNVLKEVYKIIEINWEMKDTDLPKLLSIIEKHLMGYNSKSGMVRIGCNYDGDGILEINLSDYVINRGIKKLFKDEIPIKSILRDKLIDQLLMEDNDVNIENYE
jgi:hypothetical protein